MKKETERLWELIEYTKSQRPTCNGSDDGHHTFVSYEHEGMKYCIDCDYSEEIFIGVDSDV